MTEDSRFSRNGGISGTGRRGAKAGSKKAGHTGREKGETGRSWAVGLLEGVEDV